MLRQVYYSEFIVMTGLDKISCHATTNRGRCARGGQVEQKLFLKSK